MCSPLLLTAKTWGRLRLSGGLSVPTCLSLLWLVSQHLPRCCWLFPDKVMALLSFFLQSPEIAGKLLKRNQASKARAEFLPCVPTTASPLAVAHTNCTPM